ncbi:hypothetical protein B0H14DRAFT_2569176 [Mycena olivaceomarginata]|nr:hypothetical protein B0H14DRAFT_2569176 [Mycena olivaceomarginata]
MAQLAILLMLFLSVQCIFAASVPVRETNGQRMARGLPPLPPRWKPMGTHISQKQARHDCLHHLSVFSLLYLLDLHDTFAQLALRSILRSTELVGLAILSLLICWCGPWLCCLLPRRSELQNGWQCPGPATGGSG